MNQQFTPKTYSGTHSVPEFGEVTFDVKINKDSEGMYIFLPFFFFLTPAKSHSSTTYVDHQGEGVFWQNTIRLNKSIALHTG
jgi:hypothetical protein